LQTTDTHQTANITVRLIAVTIAAVSACSLWMSSAILVHTIFNHESVDSRLFMLFFPLPEAVLSLWFLYVAYHGWFHRAATAIRRLCGALAFIAFCFGMVFWDLYIRDRLPLSLQLHGAFFFAPGFAMAILFYLLTRAFHFHL